MGAFGLVAWPRKLTVATAVAPTITVSREAGTRLIKLGVQVEFERIVEHVVQMVPGLRALDVVLAHDPECIDDPRIILEATCPDRGAEYDATQWNWNAWMIANFAPEVFQHFVLMIAYEADNAR
jgi:hypothetical protein